METQIIMLEEVAQMGSNIPQLCKIIYFDEESVTDYVQIMFGGNLRKEDQMQEQEAEKIGATGKAEASVVGKILSLISVKAELGVKAETELLGETANITKSVLTNTILTDFIGLVNQQDNQSNAVKRFAGYRIYAQKDSFSHMLLLTPYLSMLKGGTIPAGDVSIAMEKVDNAIRSAKGYYEFIGEKETGEQEEEERKVIFRFNIKAFRNNYRAADLLKMNVCLYAILVGSSSIDQLNAGKEFNIPLETKNNPDYVESSSNTNKTNEDDTRPINVYDVLLVGVEHND